MRSNVDEFQAPIDVELCDVDAQGVVIDLLLLDEDVEVSH